MYSDYSVTASNNYLSGFSGSRSGFVVRKHSELSEDKIKTIANLKDDEIVIASIDYAQRKTDKTVAGKLVKVLPSLFVTAVPLLIGAFSKGSLSDKAKTALSTGLIFGGTIALMNKYDKGMDRVENASEKIENARKKHPVAASIFDFTAKAALAFGAGLAVFKGGKYLQNKFKPSADKIGKAIEKTSKKLDNSLLGRGVEKLNNKTENFLNKHPKIADFISKNSFLAPALVILGWFGFETAVQYSAMNKELESAGKMADELLYHRELARILLNNKEA